MADSAAADAAALVERIEALGARLGSAKASIDRRFIGQEKVVDLVLTAMLCGGHALLVGLPGLGKTRLVDTLSTVMGLKGNRIQFTPDLMPADILGSEVLETAPDGSRAFRFIQGPVFCQLLMADEINRASPRTQSALLQAMQEREVTIAGQARPLGRPFHVLATQNPIEQEGTYPLPEAQLDRFLVQVDVTTPAVRRSAISCWPPRGRKRPKAIRSLPPMNCWKRKPCCAGCPWATRWLRRSLIWSAPAVPASLKAAIWPMCWLGVRGRVRRRR